MAISHTRSEVAQLDFSALPQIQDSPSMQFYCAEWLTGTSTQAMTAEQAGAFINLLAQSWRQSPPCSLPDEANVLAAYSRVGNRKCWDRVGGFVYEQFVKCTDERLRNPWQVNVWLGMLRRRGRLIAAVVKLTSGRRLAPELWQALRLKVFERDGYQCVYCGSATQLLHCDHVIPVSRGGSNEIDNLATACKSCNLSKHDKTPDEWRPRHVQ